MQHQSSAPAHTSPEDHDQDERPHACADGAVYIGHLAIDEDGNEVEVLEAVPCRKCT